MGNEPHTTTTNDTMTTTTTPLATFAARFHTGDTHIMIDDGSGKTTTLQILPGESEFCLSIPKDWEENDDCETVFFRLYDNQNVETVTDKYGRTYHVLTAIDGRKVRFLPLLFQQG